jgi:hypothetical protein
MAQSRDAWREYRKYRRLLVWGVLAGLALFAGGILLARSWHSARPFYVGLALLVGALAWTSVPLAEFPCPRCGEPFSHRGRARNLFARRCLHCQHPKWSDPA